MAEYIDRKEAIKAIESLPNCYNGFSDTYDKACIIGVLEELLAADVVERKEVKTNADRIRAMTDEELAVFLSQTEEHLFTGNLWSIKTWNEWLKKEVEDG